LGINPTGKPVEFSGVTIGRFRDGKIVELWTETDQLRLMQQLGKYTS
jgi:predicted ester cyclase